MMIVGLFFVAAGFAGGFYVGRKTALLAFLKPSAETSAKWQVVKS